MNEKRMNATEVLERAMDEKRITATEVLESQRRFNDIVFGPLLHAHVEHLLEILKKHGHVQPDEDRSGAAEEIL